jgi:hypothetical protein
MATYFMGSDEFVDLKSKSSGRSGRGASSPLSCFRRNFQGFHRIFLILWAILSRQGESTILPCFDSVRKRLQDWLARRQAAECETNRIRLQTSSDMNRRLRESTFA